MSRKIALKVSSVAVALGALISAALADSVTRTDAQMDQITAGMFIADGNGILTDSNGIKYYPTKAFNWVIPRPGGTDPRSDATLALNFPNQSWIDSNGVTWTPKDLEFTVGVGAATSGKLAVPCVTRGGVRTAATQV